MIRAPIALLFAGVLAAADFSGDWILVEERSHLSGPAAPEPILKITQDAATIRCQGADASWTYAIKWDGDALLVNSAHGITDRWQLSPDRNLLTIRRAGAVEGIIVYRRAGTLVPRSAPAAGEAVVPAGTHILLALTNSLNPKRSRDGDRVYLRTDVPVAAGGRIVIPRGSTVFGTIVEVKGAKRKGDLYIRFDTLTLPSGASFDLRARPDGGREGKIATPSDGGKDARKVATGAGIGASVGGIAGAASGHAGAGIGIGGLAGAAAGLASVFSKRGDVTLRPGTHVDMVIERDLRF